MPCRTSRVLAAALALLLLHLHPGPAQAQGRAPAAGPAPALALVLLVDASASITDGGWTFQLRGHAAAFRDPRVAEAIGSVGSVAVALATFSSPGRTAVLVPWTVVDGPESAARFADAIDAAPVDGRGGSTAIGSAIDAASRLFATAPGRPPRRTIDISSNGFSNAGVDPAAARDRAEAAGITINALAILDEFDWLEEYFRDEVIGGVGAFVRVAVDRDTFFEAILAKLVQEIADAAPARALAAR